MPGRENLCSQEKRVSENCIRFYGSKEEFLISLAKLRMDDISFLMDGWMYGWMDG
jgi:hypothetical protein